jgi:hypothetical protein
MLTGLYIATASILAGCDLMTGPKYVYSPECPIRVDTIWVTGAGGTFVGGIVKTQVGTGYCRL